MTPTPEPVYTDPNDEADDRGPDGWTHALSAGPQGREAFCGSRRGNITGVHSNVTCPACRAAHLSKASNDLPRRLRLDPLITVEMVDDLKRVGLLSKKEADDLRFPVASDPGDRDDTAEEEQIKRSRLEEAPRLIDTAEAAGVISAREAHNLRVRGVTYEQYAVLRDTCDRALATENRRVAALSSAAAPDPADRVEGPSWDDVHGGLENVTVPEGEVTVVPRIPVEHELIAQLPKPLPVEELARFLAQVPADALGRGAVVYIDESSTSATTFARVRWSE